jgi:hypothetical protein
MSFGEKNMKGEEKKEERGKKKRKWNVKGCNRSKKAKN